MVRGYAPFWIEPFPLGCRDIAERAPLRDVVDLQDFILAELAADLKARAEAKKRERRERVVAKAQAAFDKAERDHSARTTAIEAERAAVEKRAQDEEARWEKHKEKLATALRQARSD